MDYRNVVKNSASYALMHRDAMAKRIAHAYLVVGDDEELSNALISLFLSECIFGSDAQYERMSRFACADVIRLPHGDSVLTSDVKEITDTVYFTPTELSRKFYVVEKAETMNVSAQNKLLKVLEEPPSAVTIILRASTTKTLLPTVLSRVKRVDVDKVKEEDIVDMLVRAYGEESKVYLAAALSSGSISKAETVMKERRHEEMFFTVISMLKGMKTSRNVLPYSAKLMSYKDDLGELVDIIELVLGDCLLASAGVRDRLRFKSAIKDVIDISAQYTASVVVRLRDVIVRARKRIEGNGNAQSIIDELLFSMLEVKAKCLKS